MAAFVGLPSLSVGELWHLGRKQYQDSLYKPALKTLTALSEREPASIELSELLAATCAKQETPVWDHALKWGRHAITLDRLDARGYLCTAKILIKMNQKKRAIALYDVGIEKCRTEDPNFQRLVKSRDAATGTVVSPTHRDPMSVLPAELVLEIFHRLSFQQMVKCCRVSKAWKTFLRSWPELWKKIDLGLARNIRPSVVKDYIRYSEYRLEAANLGTFSHPKTWWAMARCCPRLTSLEISQNNTLHLEDFLRVLDKIPSLQSLTIGMGIHAPFVYHALQILPKLVEARFLCVRSLAHVPTPSLSAVSFKQDSLQHFECRIDGFLDPSDISLRARHFQNTNCAIFNKV
jgi:hypothetical protein